MYINAVLYFGVLYVTVVYFGNFGLVLYAVIKNLTHEEMYDSYKCHYLWNRIHYVAERKILMRKFNNPMDKGNMQNLKLYL